MHAAVTPAEIPVRSIRAVVYGVGAMGAIATRLMLEKGVVIVGAIARSSDKVGKDLGEVAGLGYQTNVLVESDAAKVLRECAPDIAVIAVSSYLREHRTQLELCARAGVNAVTISEEALYPWRTSPDVAVELDELAKAHGITITGSGHQDAFWVNMVSNLMGVAHRITSVTGNSQWNVDDYGPEVARDQHVGETPAEFEQFLADATRPPSFGRNSLEALIADSGLTIASAVNSTRAEIAEHQMSCKSLGIDVEQGMVIGFTDTERLTTEEGVEFTFDMTGRVYGPGDEDINHWIVEGEPTLSLLNPCVPTQMSTCTQLVNRIPDVINAPPGFVTIEKLPRLRYRPAPLGTYLT